MAGPIGSEIDEPGVGGSAMSGGGYGGSSGGGGFANFGGSTASNGNFGFGPLDLRNPDYARRRRLMMQMNGMPGSGMGNAPMATNPYFAQQGSAPTTANPVAGGYPGYGMGGAPAQGGNPMAGVHGLFGANGMVQWAKTHMGQGGGQGYLNPMGDPALIGMLEQKDFADAGARDRASDLGLQNSGATDPSQFAAGHLMSHLYNQGLLSEHLNQSRIQSALQNQRVLQQDWLGQQQAARAKKAQGGGFGRALGSIGGALLGSAIPGIGTALGAGIGGAFGGGGSGQSYNYLDENNPWGGSY